MHIINFPHDPSDYLLFQPINRTETFHACRFFLSLSDVRLSRGLLMGQDLSIGIGPPYVLDTNLNDVHKLDESRGMAESGKFYVFYRRKGVRFHDGGL